MSRPRTIAVVTGARADFGLLRPVIQAILEHPQLELHLAVTGAHLLPPAYTAEDVREAFPVAVELPMQRPGAVGRAADAAAVGRGVSGFAAWLQDRPADWLVVARKSSLGTPLTSSLLIEEEGDSRRLREDPSRGGLGVVGESPPSKRTRQFSHRLVVEHPVDLAEDAAESDDGLVQGDEAPSRRDHLPVG